MHDITFKISIEKHVFLSCECHICKTVPVYKPLGTSMRQPSTEKLTAAVFYSESLQDVTWSDLVCSLQRVQSLFSCLTTRILCCAPNDFILFVLFLCKRVSENVGVCICSPQYTVRWFVSSSVCMRVCVLVCPFPGEISCLQHSQRGWQMTTRLLISSICDPLRRHKHP